MKTRTHSILVNLPGIHWSLEALMPDMYAANAARSLLDAGHETEVADFCTLEMFDRLFPGDARPAAEEEEARRCDAGRGAFSLLSGLRNCRRVAHALRARGRQVHEDLAKGLSRRRHLDFVAFRLGSPDKTDAAASVARRLRDKRPDVRLVGFGPLPPKSDRAQWAQLSVFDCVCNVDARTTLVGLAMRFRSPHHWQEVPGVVSRPWEKDTGRTQPFAGYDSCFWGPPAYEPTVYPALNHSSKLKVFSVEDTIGRPLPVSGQPSGESPGGVRTKTARRVCEEIDRLQKHFGARAVHFTGIYAPPWYAQGIACELLLRGSDIAYSRWVDVGPADPDLFATLRASGCQAAAFPLHTGSQRLIEDYYGRSFTVSQAEEVLRRCRASGVSAVVGIGAFSPEDDHHTLAETVRILERTKPCAAIAGAFEESAGVFCMDARRRDLSGVSRVRRAADLFSGGMIGQSSTMALIHLGEELRHELARCGIGATQSPVAVLVARLLGFENEVPAFLSDMERKFRCGDSAGVAEVVGRFNECACTRPEVIPFGAPVALRAAVEN